MPVSVPVSVSVSVQVVGLRVAMAFAGHGDFQSKAVIVIGRYRISMETQLRTARVPLLNHKGMG